MTRVLFPYKKHTKQAALWSDEVPLAHLSLLLPVPKEVLQRKWPFVSSQTG